MPVYFFKLLGGVGDRAETEINVDFDASVVDVKEMIRKTFKIAPMLSIELMSRGKKLSDDMKWGLVDARPMKDTVLVIGHRED
jgi:hypothetical protein